MIPAERQQCIRELLDARGMVSIADMAEHLGVSRMTVRRDMQALERMGQAMLVSGGARRVGRIGFELPLAEKRDLRAAEKGAIAEKAADLARPGMAVFFDAGTTCLAVAEAIAARPDLRDSILAVTNDFTIVSHLMAHAGCRLYHTGGEVLRDNKSCIGETSAGVISRLNLDLAFVSSSSWNAEWISTPNESKIAVKHAILKATRATYLVSDSSKFGRLGFFNVVRPQEMDGIITDTGLPGPARELLLRAGINLILAEPSAAAEASTRAPTSPIEAR
ncbi:Uncharacterized HTH-type transcriptional regulator YgbI [uncultured Alphaproteobacteria bacterium]|uniref:Uncharacterized HTH-type transcriptional regulator YgbI n=1 Tax=uncultured Alphaproteobacteria bacterium TaxID=91750 RepID=A0A212J2B4_9PROT|nr:Uncharacterized HTH-type transcriptional regulator YgbI [uncultured Alphaproteobacteria bacterium]